MSFISALLTPARKAANLLPKAAQDSVLSAGRLLVKGLAFFRPLKIKYRGYDVYVSGAERGGIDIYMFWVLHGRWRHEIYEQEVVADVLKKARNPFVLDVGASYGMYSLLAASEPNVIGVIAIEASQRTYKFLERTVVENGLLRRVEVMNEAASAVSGMSFDVVEMENSEWNRITEGDGSESVRSIAVDDLLSRVPEDSVVFVKMDIEGHEPDAFEGMKVLLGRRGGFVVLFEFHVGLMQDRSCSFAEVLFSVPASRLFMLDAGGRAVRELDPPKLGELIEKAKVAPHPLNLYNLLLISDSLAGLLPGNGVRQ